jgi:NDP-sugar pyrophosphorylase family protein
MKAIRINTQKRIQPFDDLVGDSVILNRKLLDIQNDILQRCGVELVETPPENEPFILLSDRIWFTEIVIKKMLQCGTGRLRCTDKIWAKNMNSILEIDEELYDLAIMPKGSSAIFENIHPMEYDWQLRDGTQMNIHSSMKHALRPMRIGAHLVMHINHWCDLLRVNQYALLAKSELVRYKWKNSSIFTKFYIVIYYLLKIRSIRERTVLRRIGSIGKGCKIHSTAVVEACEIGDDVTIGPYSVVRASVIGNGVNIEEHATVNLSVIGPNSRVGRYATSNLSLTMKDSMISYGFGYQSCIFGRNSFVAVGATLLDLSFGKTIKVEHDGQWVDTKQHFMGICVGHDCALGNGVRVNYGVSIPNGSLLVANNQELIQDSSAALKGIPFLVDGKTVISVAELRKKSRKEQ